MISLFKNGGTEEYRVVFTWTALGAEGVEIVDYH
jgi:plasmid maintenance system killer protein